MMDCDEIEFYSITKDKNKANYNNVNVFHFTSIIYCPYSNLHSNFGYLLF